MVVFGTKYLLRSEMLVIGQTWLNSGMVVVFRLKW